MSSKRVSAVVRLAAFAFAQGLASAASAQSAGCLDCDGHRDVGVLVFGGVMTESDFPGPANLPWLSSYEDNYIAGVALSRDLVDLGLGFHFGGEVGLASRFGDGSSAELWAGPGLRHEGLDIGPLSLTVGLVVGLSVVTDAIGSERKAETDNGGDATLLYYAGPEVGVAFKAMPDTEFVFRTHHRSGGLNVPFLPTINNMPNASNANIVGIRKRF